MCGICGFVDRRNTPARARMAWLREMSARLLPRGPDQSGLYAGDTVGLASQRLSIIDIGGGRQPMCSEDGSVWCVHNGEIYNYRELKKELIGQGHRFRTQCDTEVLVHLFEQMGAAMVERLDGMFALAVWDSRTRGLFLARDPFGMKPLYYASLDGLFLFASEPKALLAHPSVGRELDLAALGRYLVLEYVPAPLSIFKHIRKSPPGHCLYVRNGGVRLFQYWDVPVHQRIDDLEPRQALGLSESLEATLRQSVRRHMVGSVPIGALLSGGIDSGLITAFMRDEAPEQIVTISMGFDRKTFDESQRAKCTAAHLGTRHVDVVFPSSLAADTLAEVAEVLDEPLADNSTLPTYLLCKHAREHCTAVVSGEGGDELFAGYPTYQAHRLAETYTRLIPRGLHAFLAKRLNRWLPVSLGDMSLDFKLRKFMAGIGPAPAVRHHLWLGAFRPDELPALCTEGLLSTVRDSHALSEVIELERKVRSRDLVTRMQYLDIKLYLADGVLVKCDRLSMAWGLEMRMPFLCKNVANFAFSLPPSCRMRRLRGKYLLRQLAARHLPAGISTRAKKGFGAPVGRWLREELRDMVGDLLSPTRIAQGGLFNPGYVQTLVRQHWEGTADHRQRLWTLLMFELWRERWLTGGSGGQ